MREQTLSWQRQKQCRMLVSRANAEIYWNKIRETKQRSRFNFTFQLGDQWKTVVMIQLIMGKIKSKCKINLSGCRRWNQIDAPSVHRICSPEYGSLVAGAQSRVTKSNIQYGVESYFVSFTVLYVSRRPWRGWPELLRSPAYKTTTLRLCTYLRVGCFFCLFLGGGFVKPISK